MLHAITFQTVSFAGPLAESRQSPGGTPATLVPVFSPIASKLACCSSCSHCSLQGVLGLLELCKGLIL